MMMRSQRPNSSTTPNTSTSANTTSNVINTTNSPNTSNKRYGVTEPISLNQPTQEDLQQSAQLLSCLTSSGFFESEEEGELREHVLGKLNVAIREFVREVAKRKRLPAELVKTTTGKIFTFGSYRLGVHGRGADIDTLCVAPQHVTREDFFTILPEILIGSAAAVAHTLPVVGISDVNDAGVTDTQDEATEQAMKSPQVSLAPKILNVTHLTLVQDAYVPVMNLEAEGIKIDLVFARIPGEVTILDSFDLLSNRMLSQLDEKCVLSVNGSRTTDEILKMVPSVDTFHGALRAVKLWAKRRGLYGNSYGYLNGVACAILTARVCQLYPNAAPSIILSRFFAIFLQWRWPSPVYLKNIEEGSGGMKVWNPRLYPSDRYHRMPIITPSYPSMCSTHNVSDSTMKVLLGELERGSEVCKRLSNTSDWSELFTKSDFFCRQRIFFQIIAVAKTEVEHRAWSGYVESRVRHLTMNLEREADIDMAPPYPDSFEVVYQGNDGIEGLLAKHYIAPSILGTEQSSEATTSSTACALTDMSESASSVPVKAPILYSSAFYVGLSVKTDPTVPRAPRKLCLDQPVKDFKTYVLGWEKFQPASMSLYVRDIRRDNLPEYVFVGGPSRPAPRVLGRTGSNLSTGSGGSKKRSSEAL